MASVAELWRRIRGVAKGAVKVARELCAVAHHRHQIESILVERTANPANAAIHHVARTDAISAGFGKRNRGPGQFVQSFIELDSLFVQHRAMSVRRVRAETRVNPKAETLAKLFANLRDGFVSTLMIEPAFFLRRRNRKEQKVGDAVVQILFDLPQRRRNVMTKVAAQTGNWLCLIQSIDYEEWLNQLGAIEFSFRA